MKRSAGVMILLAATGGCMSTERSPRMSCGGGTGTLLSSAPGVQGPWGQPLPMTAAHYGGESPGAAAAHAMLAQNMPMDLAPQTKNSAYGSSGNLMVAGGAMMPNSGVVQAGGRCGPGGACMSTGQPMSPNAGAMASAYGGAGMGGAARFQSQRTSVKFVSPGGMRISWFGTDGSSTANVLQVPSHYNFLQAAIYRIKLANIANYPGVELYPTLEIVPANAKTDTFLAHSAVPVAFTDEDFEQVRAGNYLVKVVYLPDPQYQDLATTGPDEVVSTRLEPGVDPIAEARRRGSILLVVRMGNINLESAHSPGMNAPGSFMPMPPGMPGMAGMPGPAMLPPRTTSLSPNGPMMAPPIQGAPPLPPSTLTLPQGAPTLPAPPASDEGPVSKKPTSSPYQQVKYEVPQAAAPAAGQGSSKEARPIWEKNWWSENKKP